MFFHVLCLLLLNLVEELYCQNRKTTELEILHEDRYSSQVGPPKKILCKQCCLQVNNINSLWQYIIIAIHVSIYRIAGNFRGVLIFVIFVTIPRVTKFSTHEIFHPRIFSRLLRIGLRKSRNLKPRKLILKTRDSFSRKFAPPKITRYTELKKYRSFGNESFYIYLYNYLTALTKTPVCRRL